MLPAEEALSTLRGFAADEHGDAGPTHLYLAVMTAIEVLDAYIKATKQPPMQNRGMPWSEEEDRRLLAAWDTGHGYKDLAVAHDRTITAIKYRLLKYGRINTV